VDAPRLPLCPVCSSFMIEKTGRYGPFLSCSRYPQCRGSTSIPTASVAPPASSHKIVERAGSQQPTIPAPDPMPRREFEELRRSVGKTVVERPRVLVKRTERNEVSWTTNAFVKAGIALGTGLLGTLISVRCSRETQQSVIVPPVVVQPVAQVPAAAQSAKQATAAKEATAASTEIPRCPKCGSPMRVRHGRNGYFFGCSKYPQCKGTRDLPDDFDISPYVFPPQGVDPTRWAP
jgi:ssDNA-binding Zn-finger/Zn-ribbon topoisomerase 1